MIRVLTAGQAITFLHRLKQHFGVMTVAIPFSSQGPGLEAWLGHMLKVLLKPLMGTQRKATGTQFPQDITQMEVNNNEQETI
jgi:hypothetical protein